jgi:hypothetical protein
MVALGNLFGPGYRKQDTVSLKECDQIHYPPDYNSDNQAGIAVGEEKKADQPAQQEQYRTDTDGKRNRSSPI